MTSLVPSFSNGSSTFLQVTRSAMKAWMGLNFGKIPFLTSELAALERVKKSMNSVVTTLGPSFLIASSPFLQATRTPKKSRIGLKLDSIRHRTYELPALECLEKSP